MSAKETKMKRIHLYHPLKHHLFYSGAGIVKATKKHSTVLYFGFYDNNRFIRFLLNQMGKTQHLGYKHDVVTPFILSPFDIKFYFLLQNMKSSMRKKFYDAFYAKAKRMLKNADIIHVINSTENSEIIQIAREKGKVIVLEQIGAYDYKYYISGEITNTDEDKEISLYKQNLNNANFIICPSEFVVNSIIMHEWGKKLKEKIVQIPYGVELSHFKYKKKKYNGTLKLLTVAGVSSMKGIDYLLDAMEDLKFEDVHLTIYGAKRGNEGELLINRMHELNNVTYAGTISHAQIQNAYNENDIFILPSLIEGSSLSSYEALASGLPCIVTNNVGSVVEDGVDGLIIEWKNKESIVEAIRKFYRQDLNIELMSERARMKAEMYTWRKFEENISNLYDKLL